MSEITIDRDKRSRWAWEVRINGRAYARCVADEDARMIASAIRILKDAQSDYEKLAHIGTRAKPRTLYVIAVPSDDSNLVRLIGDENGKPFTALAKAEAAGQSTTVFANSSFVLPLIPWNEGHNEMGKS